jgi:tRNA dimethylallyltransferase
LLAAGVATTARPFSGYVYLRVLEHLRGQRLEAETRELITQENRHYARRQLIWFRKEPNLVWIPYLGDHTHATDEATRILVERLGVHPDVHTETESHAHAADV